MRSLLPLCLTYVLASPGAYSSQSMTPGNDSSGLTNDACCYSKVVGPHSYSLVKEGMTPSNCPTGCIYNRDQAEDLKLSTTQAKLPKLYCFSPGNLTHHLPSVCSSASTWTTTKDNSKQQERKLELMEKKEENKMELKEKLEEKKLQIKENQEEKRLELKERQEEIELELKEKLEEKKLELKEKLEEKKLELMEKQEEKKLEQKEKQEEKNLEIKENLEEKKLKNREKQLEQQLKQLEQQLERDL